MKLLLQIKSSDNFCRSFNPKEEVFQNHEQLFQFSNFHYYTKTRINTFQLKRPEQARGYGFGPGWNMSSQ